MKVYLVKKKRSCFFIRMLKYLNFISFAFFCCCLVLLLLVLIDKSFWLDDNRTILKGTIEDIQQSNEKFSATIKLNDKEKLFNVTALGLQHYEKGQGVFITNFGSVYSIGCFFVLSNFDWKILLFIFCIFWGYFFLRKKKNYWKSFYCFISFIFIVEVGSFLYFHYLYKKPYGLTKRTTGKIINIFKEENISYFKYSYVVKGKTYLSTYVKPPPLYGSFSKRYEKGESCSVVYSLEFINLSEVELEYSIPLFWQLLLKISKYILVLAIVFFAFFYCIPYFAKKSSFYKK